MATVRPGPAASASGASAARWEYEENGKRWAPMPAATSRAIEEAHASFALAKAQGRAHAGTVDATAGATVYRVDFARMQQRNTSTSFVRRVRRVAIHAHAHPDPAAAATIDTAAHLVRPRSPHVAGHPPPRVKKKRPTPGHGPPHHAAGAPGPRLPVWEWEDGRRGSGRWTLYSAGCAATLEGRCDRDPAARFDLDVAGRAYSVRARQAR